MTRSSLAQMAQEALGRDPATRAIEFEGCWHDWGEVSALAKRVMALLEETGIAADAPVGFVARNHPSALAAQLGLIAADRRIVMIYPFQSPEALAGDISRAHVAALVGAEGDIAGPVLDALRDSGTAAIALDGMAARTVPGFETASADFEYQARGEPRIEILTSGTTGPPKRFPIPYRMISEHLIGKATTPGASTSGRPSAAPFLLFMPLGNISGIYTTIPPMLQGQPVVLLERFSIAGWRDFVVRYRPVMSGVPAAMVRALLDADIPREDLASIRFMGVGAAPLDPDVQAAFEERYGIPILLSYGATEFGGPVASMKPEHIEEFGFAKRGSVGRALGEARLRIVDPESGAELPPGREGLLEVVSPRMGPDWMRTSDVAVLDADGFLYIRGRADGAINRGGFKLLPGAIERALMEHASVAAACVVAVPDRKLGEVPGAAIQARPGTATLDSSELERHLRERLPATYIPRHWRVLEELPRTPSEKIDKAATRRLFQTT